MDVDGLYLLSLLLRPYQGFIGFPPVCGGSEEEMPGNIGRVKNHRCRYLSWGGTFSVDSDRQQKGSRVFIIGISSTITNKLEHL